MFFVTILSFFFFSSRRRHTISLCDWSSDVCSSDLGRLILPLIILPLLAPVVIFGAGAVSATLDGLDGTGALELLAAFSFAAVLLSPFAAAASVRLNLGS